jgi:hypothetical protein
MMLFKILYVGLFKLTVTAKSNSLIKQTFFSSINSRLPFIGEKFNKLKYLFQRSPYHRKITFSKTQPKYQLQKNKKLKKQPIKCNSLIGNCLILHDVSNMLYVMGKTKTFDLNFEKNVLMYINKILKINNIQNKITQRIIVGSSISNTTCKGYVFNNNIFVSPGIQNPIWGIQNCIDIKKLYPNLIYNYAYVEYKHDVFSKEEMVDYKGATNAKKKLHLVDNLILLSSDGNNHEKYGFRNLVEDAILNGKKVFVIGKNPNKFYKKLAKQKKISLVCTPSQI